jgi:metal transporter CNNM
MESITWLGIFFCLTQSGMFSGLNLALFGVSRLRLEIEASSGNKAALRMLTLRKDSNFTLTTVLWGNVAVNTLLAILSNSVLTGLGAFVFSTVIITFIGEIVPQAYFSRHALKMASMLSPILKFYQKILYPVAKPCARILDWWLGKEGIQYFRESDLREVIKKHIESAESDIDAIEGTGALNFFALDDLAVSEEGVLIDPLSIISLPFKNDLPQCPEFERSPADPFLRKLQASGKKWVIVTDEAGTPHVVLDSDAFLRDALFGSGPFDAYGYCHRPIIVPDIRTPIGQVLWMLKVRPERSGDHVIDKDIILVWNGEKRVITGADIFGRLMKGIVARELT